MADLFQGPAPPWCIGAVFRAPHLRAGADRGPLLFDSVGEPQQLLSTGCKLHLFDHPIPPLEKQSRYAGEDASIGYTPDSLLQGLVQEDTAAKVAMIHESNNIFGNRLECMQCQDGKLQLTFPVGENFNSIGSILCKRDPAGRLCPLKKQEDEPDSEWLGGVRMSVSPTLNHPIRQLSAMKISNSSVDENILVARTQHQVHVMNVLREEDRVCFASRSVTTYRQGVSHVVWSPYIEGELATVLESGEVFVYNVHSTKQSTNNLRANFIVQARMVEAATADGSGAAKFPKAVVAEIWNLRRSWWRVEYGWHPKLLVIANAEDILLSDLRHGNATTLLGTVGNSKNYCHQRRCEQDRFVAIVRPEDRGYHFAAATMEHIMLFDIRRPRMPLLQWEHSMHDDSPGYLSMHPLSWLRPEEDNGAGRVILAASFRSGDVRAFCYGPQAPSTAIVSGASSRFREIEEAYCAWDLPSKIFTSRPRKLSMTALYDSLSTGTQDSYIESLSGVAVLPGAKTGFSLLQLTGTGDILNQPYIASKTLKREKNTKLCEYPDRLIAKNKKKLVMKNCSFPAMLNYVKHGLDCLAALGSSHESKRLKATVMDPVEDYQDRIYKVLSDVEVFLSNHEISFKVLLLGLSQDLALHAAKMPSNVTGYIDVTDRTPYLRPPLKYLEMQETPVPVPLPVLLEIQAKEGNRKATKESFQAACDAVETVTSSLRKKQEEPIVSLGQGEDASFNLSQQLLFHSKHSDSGASSSSSTGSMKSQNYVGSQQLVGGEVGSSKVFGRLKSDEFEPSTFGALERLQMDFEKWQQNYAPYVNYCKGKRL
ncbi:uncharacterized protein LOC9633859 [Selaginella moellendorffii]|uniref:uncharacterized protein LOC9633859 n=1 Tax=Selaginella moellendorffii TaxID=88036 RepID=UPI000D1CB967|nr:uncharacterized protein LOC9633859 [Selaginella moellendorffii]XP_024539993.1 uncharacterized protein LOC9633859 [Selaginella moellendorffii]XP_024539995.1 uncharacterized protein LOC9633859 [Selaginella moellendorffii]XP_024539996.1 uncharacterized protein LOC9633859 [Selaginella moellendorffii]XP_024539997.1 uncharacterized protein LOC9633859 [Selaginella moellendorffii]|eukprot:XP_024539992.1 uncharacterized protein LOC9633859 [Selaginella moellendorffii]